MHREDRNLLPWVSMAEALLWGMTARPSVTLSAKEGQTGGNRPLEAGSGARDTLDRARADGEWVDGPSAVSLRRDRGAGMLDRYGDRPDRSIDEPAPTITAGVKGSGPRLSWVSNGQANATSRDVDEPAPTILAGGTSPGEQAWVLRAGTNANDCSRPVDEPAPTIRYGARLNDVSWVLRSGQSVAGEGRAERSVDDPSTLVNCDPRIAEPGRHDPDESTSQYGAGTVRVTVEEAAALQSFPAGYPWEAAGTRTAAFRCVGNAVPCGLARAIVSMAVGTT